MQLVGIVADAAKKHFPEAIFIDETGIGGPVVDRLRQLKIANVFGVNFGGKRPPKRQYNNQASYMWGELRDWLKSGGAIEYNEDLRTELITREYYFDADNRYILESKDDLKERGESSPDRADALALTFAMPVGPRDPRITARVAAGLHDGQFESAIGVDFDPYNQES
jgi:hypothetical protein